MIGLLFAALQAEVPAPAAVAPACTPGVYLAGETAEVLTPIAERMTDHRKVSGLLAYALLGGMTSLKVKTVLPGSAAQVRTKASKPSFIFCFEHDDKPSQPGSGGEMGYVGVSAAASTPGEFRLVRFDVAGKQREVPLSAMSITGPKTGAIEKTTVRFETEELGPGRYRVTPREILSAGEYGFLKTAGNTTAANGGTVAPERVFDFAVE